MSKFNLIDYVVYTVFDMEAGRADFQIGYFFFTFVFPSGTFVSQMTTPIDLTEQPLNSPRLLPNCVYHPLSSPTEIIVQLSTG